MTRYFVTASELPELKEYGLCVVRGVCDVKRA